MPTSRSTNVKCVATINDNPVHTWVGVLISFASAMGLRDSLKDTMHIVAYECMFRTVDYCK